MKGSQEETRRHDWDFLTEVKRMFIKKKEWQDSRRCCSKTDLL
jgi:hypothetical protein